MITANYYLSDLKQTCLTCGDATSEKCNSGHPFCRNCRSEQNVCEGCLEAMADVVRGLA
jgi:hypothetical protein